MMPASTAGDTWFGIVSTDEDPADGGAAGSADFATRARESNSDTLRVAMCVAQARKCSLILTIRSLDPGLVY